MFADRSNWKAILLLMGILAATTGSPTPAAASGGIWWYGESKQFSVTLINLTEHTLISTYSDVDVSDNCYSYPFQVVGVNVESYKSAIWLSEETPPVFLLHYSGKMTFLPKDMDEKWKFDLNFHPQNGSGATLGQGTWIYLTANDNTNTGWVQSWNPLMVPQELYQSYLGYATRMNDGKPRNLMNLEATEIGMAVSVYSPNNKDVVVVVQTVDETDTYYRAWKLDWADNDQNSLPLTAAIPDPVPVPEPVAIDIKPGAYPNSINPKSKGKIPVAILSTKDFNAPKMVDRDSLTFGATGDEDSLAFCNPKGEYINGDRLKDLVCHFYTEDTEFLCGDTEGVLKGMTMDGTPIEGRDSVKIVPCKK